MSNEIGRLSLFFHHCSDWVDRNKYVIITMVAVTVLAVFVAICFPKVTLLGLQGGSRLFVAGLIGLGITAVVVLIYKRVCNDKGEEKVELPEPESPEHQEEKDKVPKEVVRVEERTSSGLDDDRKALLDILEGRPIVDEKVRDRLVRGSIIDPVLASKGEEALLALGSKCLELSHNYIQWLFPTMSPSGTNPKAPYLNEELIGQVTAEGRKLQVRAFVVMLRFWGFECADDGTDIRPGEVGQKVLARYGNHNLLRVSRVLQSLVIFNPDLATVFFRVLKALQDNSHNSFFEAESWNNFEKSVPPSLR